MAATIADVAELAGVSTATVSRVLAGVGRARPDTRARVLDAARALDYRPSEVARSLQRRSTQTIGLVITDIENPYFPQLVRSVEDGARAAGYAVLLCNAADDPEREAFYLELLADRRVDGLIIAASSLGVRHVEWLASPPVPVVLVNTAAPDLGLPSVTSDNELGARLATEHVLGLGHRRLGFLRPPPRNVDAPLRLAGIRSAMLDAGLAPHELAIATGDPLVGGGEVATEALLRTAPDDDGDPGLQRPDGHRIPARAAASRATGAGRYERRRLRRRGHGRLRRPAAHDDRPANGRHGPVGHRPAAHRDAAPDEDAAGAESGESDVPTLVRLPVDLQVRGSTGPAPTAARPAI